MSERKLTAGSEEELRFQIMQKGLGGKFNLHLGILLAELDDLRSLRPAPAEPVTNKDPWRAGDRAAECLHCGGTGTAEADGREGECAECGGLGGLDPQGRGVVLDENGDAVPPPKPPAPAERFEEWHRLNCPHPSYCGPWPDDPWTPSRVPERFSNKACKEVYASEHPPQAEQAAREGGDCDCLLKGKEPRRPVWHAETCPIFKGTPATGIPRCDSCGMYHRPWDPIPGVPCGAKPPEDPEGEPSCPKGGERCLSCGWCNCACSCKPKPPEPERIAHFSYCVHGYKRDEGCRECPSLPEHPPEERVGECPNGCNASEALRTCQDHGLPQFRKKVPGAQQTEPHSECRGGPEGLTDPAGGVLSAPTGTNPPKRYIGALAAPIEEPPCPSCAGGVELLGAAGRAMSGAANAIAICRGSTGGVLPSVVLIDSLRGLVTRIDKHLGRAGRGEA